MKRSWLAAFLWLVAFPSIAIAACGDGASNCFVVAAGGNSGTAATWSATSGGATCSGSSCPTGPAAGDTVILDAAAGQLTINATLTVAGLDARGLSANPYTNTLTHNAFALNIGGNLFVLVNGMTYAPNSTRAINFTSTSGTTLITPANKTLGTVTFNGVGGTFQLQANMATAGTTTLTAGTLDLNTRIITHLGVFIANGSTTRVVNCGSGGGFTATSTGSNTPLDFSGTNISTDGNCNLTLATVTAVGARTVNFGTSLTFASFSAAQTQSTTFPTIALSGTTPTITTMTLTGPLYVTPSASSVMAVGTFNIVGSSTGLVFLGNGSGTGTNTFNVTTAAMTWAVFQNVTFGTSAVSPTNCFALGSNFNGGTCAPPSAGGGGRIIGG